jgi:hypothetical protein
MTDPDIQAVRLDAIKTICRREGHNWAEITTVGDQLRRGMCVRGCGATRHLLWHGQTLTPMELAALMPADGAVTVTDIEIIVEPEETAQ